MRFARFRLKTPSASGCNVLSEVCLFSGCASNANACRCEVPARGQGAEQGSGCPSVALGTPFSWAEEAAVKPRERGSS